jgi:hypothetical protein
MISKIASTACLSVLAVASTGLVSCNKSFKGTAYYSSSYSRTDSSVNGHRTITKKVDGLTRKLETKTDVKMEQGKIVSFPTGSIVKMEETESATPRVAELRENGGSLELWMKENRAFRRGTAEEETWRETFLKDVIE